MCVMGKTKTLTQRAMVVRPIDPVDSFSSEAIAESDASWPFLNVLSTDACTSSIIVVPCVIVHSWYVAAPRRENV